MQDPQGLVLRPEMPSMKDAPSDVMPPADRGDITNIDENHLRGYLFELLKNDIADKQQMGWLSLRAWDVKSYYGKKNQALMQFPWPGASAFPVPLTPTLLDTAWANVNASIWSNPNGPVKVNGVQVEDIRTSKILESLLNWQVMNDMEMESETDKHIFRTLLHGTGFFKVYQDVKSGSVKCYSVDIENIYLPIDARGMQKEETDHVIHMIPLSYNDLQIRKLMKIYKYPDEIMPGVAINWQANFDEKRQLMDSVSGTSMITRARRENYYVGEFYTSYCPPVSSAYGSGGPTGAGARPIELITWMSPNGGRIQRIRKNPDGIRPFSEAHAYPFPDRFFSMSFPEKIKNEQEKLDYADKQNTDALDRAISPAGFVEDTDAFDKTRAQRVPGGIYPKGKGNKIEWEPVPAIERGFERQIALIWEQAERKTGIIDITQGRPSAYGGKTLGEVEIRSSRADVRFTSIYKRFERWFNKTMKLIYRYDNEWMPREKKIRVLGYSDYRSIDELFPKGDDVLGLNMDGTFDFNFSGKLISDQRHEDEQRAAFAESKLVDPVATANPANWWRLNEMLAEARGIRNLESILQKPKEANIYSVEEFIQRILSGQTDIQIRPGIDTEQYMFELKLFSQTETFRNLDDNQKKAMFDAYRRAFVMSVAERRAKTDLMLIKESARFNAISGGNPVPQIPEPVPSVQ